MSVTEKIKAHKHLLINVGIALIFFAGGYFTRFFTAGTTEPSGFPGNGNFTRNGEMPSMGSGSNSSTPSARSTSGTIISNSGSYITIKLSTGSTKNVYIGDTTSIYSRTKTTADQLIANKTVVVQGQTNSSDNSITGTTITIE